MATPRGGGLATSSHGDGERNGPTDRGWVRVGVERDTYDLVGACAGMAGGALGADFGLSPTALVAVTVKG